MQSELPFNIYHKFLDKIKSFIEINPVDKQTLLKMKVNEGE
jgi:hypothetical protein